VKRQAEWGGSRNSKTTERLSGDTVGSHCRPRHRESVPHITHQLRLISLYMYISLGSVIGAALPVAIWATVRPPLGEIQEISPPYSGAPLAGLLPVVTCKRAPPRGRARMSAAVLCGPVLNSQCRHVNSEAVNRNTEPPR